MCGLWFGWLIVSVCLFWRSCCCGLWLVGLVFYFRCWVVVFCWLIGYWVLLVVLLFVCLVVVIVCDLFCCWLIRGRLWVLCNVMVLCNVVGVWWVFFVVWLLLVCWFLRVVCRLLVGVCLVCFCGWLLVYC